MQLRRITRKILTSLLLSLLATLVVAAVIALCFRPEVPQPMAAVTSPFAHMDVSTLPGVRWYTARDGVPLSYRLYPGSTGQVVVLLHGSSGSGRNMHPMALDLQKQLGATVLVPDLRGHGANQPHGDIKYLGQLDDDMVDLVAALKPGLPDQPWSLVGFSSGGGFALRLAAEPQGAAFHRIVLLSPFLKHNAPTNRPIDPHQPHWYSVSVPRIAALSTLNIFGLRLLNGLPVIRFPVPANLSATTSAYSYRLLTNFAPHDDYRADIRDSAGHPMTVLVGARDDLYLPDQFAPVFHRERPDVPVTILPNLDHADMVFQPAALNAVAEALR